jgi:hypothetical protein
MMMPNPFDVICPLECVLRDRKWRDDEKMSLLDGCARMFGASMVLALFLCRRGAGSMISLKDSSVVKHPSADWAP